RSRQVLEHVARNLAHQTIHPGASEGAPFAGGALVPSGESVRRVANHAEGQGRPGAGTPDCATQPEAVALDVVEFQGAALAGRRAPGMRRAEIGRAAWRGRGEGAV